MSLSCDRNALRVNNLAQHAASKVVERKNLKEGKNWSVDPFRKNSKLQKTLPSASGMTSSGSGSRDSRRASDGAQYARSGI